MTTMKLSSLLLLSSMVFALILLPMTSGQDVFCMRDNCKSTPVCDKKCISMGYHRGGACRIYSFGGTCCCELNSNTQNAYAPEADSSDGSAPEANSPSEFPYSPEASPSEYAYSPEASSPSESAYSPEANPPSKSGCSQNKSS